MHLTTTDDEITEYLDNIKRCIEENENNLIIANNRDINLKFMVKYNLNKQKVIEILKELNKEDFEEKVINKHKEYSNELLYIFSKKLELTDYLGIKRMVTIYIKFNLLKQRVIVISFHEAKYKFKGK